MDVKNRRRLTDLYKRGTKLTVDDGEGQAVEVYLRKLSPTESESAFRRANAVRARILAMSRDDPDADYYQSIRAEVLDMEKEKLVMYATADVINRQRPAIEARVAEENGWMEDGYLQGLYDAAQSDDFLERQTAEEPDPDVARVLDEMSRYIAECETEIENEREVVTSQFEAKSLPDLQDHVLDLMVKLQADIAWLHENRKAEIQFAVRIPDKKNEYYFTKRAEVDDLDEKVLQQLIEAYQELLVEPSEGKDSGPVAASSPSVESPSEAETVEVSGPEE